MSAKFNGWVACFLVVVFLAPAGALAGKKKKQPENKVKDEKQTVLVEGKGPGQLMIERIHHFLKRLSPGMDPIGAADRVFEFSTGKKKSEAPSESMEIEVKSGVCYRVAVLGDKTIKDLSLQVDSPEGQQTLGKSIEGFMIADLCPEKEGSAAVKVKTSGSGRAALAVFAGSPEAAAYVTGGTAFNLDELLARLYAARDKLGKKMDPADTPATGMLEYGKSEAFSMDLDKDFCYKFIAVSSCKGKCGLGLSAMQGSKALVKADEKGAEAMVELCPESSFTADLVIKLSGTTRAKEAFAFIPLRKKARSELKIYAAGEKQDDYVAKKIAAQAKEACKGQSAVTPVHRGQLTTNGLESFEITLVGEICYTIIVVGKPSVKDLKVTFINPIGQEIAKDEQAGPVAVIKTKKCPQWDGKYKVNVRMFNGYGGFGLQVFGAVD
ncbi:MAG: hypothetical protein ABIJ56_22745 [Pseudomonadota bacterium]